MTYEEANKIKDMLARAEELAQAVKDGKMVEVSHPSNLQWKKSDLYNAEHFYNSITAGNSYRIAQPKTRRPWTQAEAEAHLGWVLVSPKDGTKTLITTTVGKDVLIEGWQVHPIGRPGKLKPAYVEE